MSPRRAKNALLMLAVLLGATTTMAHAQYQIESWTTDRGLPQNTVSSIVQTPDGYLWLATLDGLVRYDGVRFTIFNKNNSRGIASNRFTQLLVDGRGALWIGTEESGITRYKDGAFQTFETLSEAKGVFIRSLSLNEAGETIVATRKGIIRWDGARFVPDDSLGKDSFDARIRVRGMNGAVWYAFKNVLRLMQNGRVSEYILPGEADKATIDNIVEDGRGRVWIGTDYAGLFVLEDERIRAYTFKKASPADGHSTPRLIDRKGSLWIATDAGAVVIAPDGKVSRITTAEGLSDNILTDIYEDREGNVWIGTLYRGLNRLSRQTVQFYGTTHGLAANIVHPIYESREGDVWSGGAALTRWHNGVFTPISGDDKSLLGEVTAIEQDRTGRVWFSTLR